MAVIVYVALTLTYSTFWKHIAVLDLIAVAGGFVVRAFAGAFAVDVPVRSWFVLCISFASLLIVTGKRYAELRDLGDDASTTRATLDQYSIGYLRVIIAMSLSATVVAYCLWAFDTMQLTGSRWPFYELSIVPMVAAVMRYVLVLEQGQGGAPEEIFFSDRVLQVLGLVWVIIWGCGVYVHDARPFEEASGVIARACDGTAGCRPVRRLGCTRRGPVPGRRVDRRDRQLPRPLDDRARRGSAERGRCRRRSTRMPATTAARRRSTGSPTKPTRTSPRSIATSLRPV